MHWRTHQHADVTDKGCDEGGGGGHSAMQRHSVTVPRRPQANRRAIATAPIPTPWRSVQSMATREDGNEPA